LNEILERVFRYHVAYNELLWDMKNAHLLTVYDAGFINLNKQYLTIGINGLNQAAEFLGIECTNNDEYKEFCKIVFSTISEFCNSHKGKQFGHEVTLNVEMVPAESLAIKNYNWDKEDGYVVGDDTNLYASYVFKPNDESLSILDKIAMHSKRFAAEELSGGQAAHLNLDTHLSVEQYKKILKYAGEVGCNYFTFNVPNSQCDECGFITKTPIDECPKCGSRKISYYDRIIGYLTKIKNWSAGRQIEQKTRVYQKVEI
jgi:ribonucleoside-triphosphate reductase